jgi:hypothetical protein
MRDKGCINSASPTPIVLYGSISTFHPARPNLEKRLPGAVFIWHDNSAEGIEDTNPGKNSRQIVAEQS